MFCNKLTTKLLSAALCLLVLVFSTNSFAAEVKVVGYQMLFGSPYIDRVASVKIVDDTGIVMPKQVCTYEKPCTFTTNKVRANYWICPDWVDSCVQALPEMNDGRMEIHFMSRTVASTLPVQIIPVSGGALLLLRNEVAAEIKSKGQ